MPVDFHFLRPAALLALIPSVALWLYLARRRDPRRAWHGVVAGHLTPFVVRDSQAASGLRPDLLLGAALIMSCVALAGPTWLREPAPFADDQAALVIAVEVTPTMLAQDVQPSRLERAAQKIRDLVALRRGSASALLAYSGTAHLVLPLTEDGDLVASFAAELAPEQMPVEGDAADKAVLLAQEQLDAAGRSGSVLLVSDGVSPASLARIRSLRSNGGPRVHVYGFAAGPETIVPAGSPPAPPLDVENLKRAAAAGDGATVTVTPDGRDVEKLAGIVETLFTAAKGEQGSERWRDLGYWLLPVIALLTVPWFRRGWVVGYE